MFIQKTNFGHEAIMRCGRVIDAQHNSGDHIHQFCEIEMILDGEIEITVSGKKHIARAGDIAVIPPLKVHSFNTPEKVRMLICTMSSFFLPSSITKEELSAEREGYVFHATDALWSYLIGVGFFDNRTRRYYDPVADYELIHRLRATVHLILAEFVSFEPPIAEAEGSGALARILLYISEHYTEDLTLESVGTALGYSPKYVSNCFAELPGISFRSFVNALRIEEAKARLTATDATVLSVAIECGFKNESSFHRIFRDVTGVTPSEYRGGKR